MAFTGMLDYSMEMPAACHPLLSNRARANFHVCLTHQPWRKGNYTLDLSETDGFTGGEADFVAELVAYLPDGSRHLLEHPQSAFSRCLAASVVAGSTWEADFWRVASASLNRLAGRDGFLDTRFDLLRGSQEFTEDQREKALFRAGRCRAGDASEPLRRRAVDALICLRLGEEAVRLLLDRPPTDDGVPVVTPTREEGLRACLVATMAESNADAPHTTTKVR